jgi:dTDP-4-dehydrorhamnose 3,5-epimerase
MEVRETDLPGVVIVEPRVFGDERGFFVETWQRARYAAAGIDVDFVQDNLSRSRRGTLRGLHFQIERPQGKLVQVVRGEVFDVAVDVRRSSPTFGRWTGTVLSAENHRQMYVPPGFAHGFQVLSEVADFAYKCTEFYAPELERSVRWNDPTVAVEWPLGDAPPILSPKDRDAPLLAEAECFA